MHEGAGNGDSMGSFKTRVQMAHAGDMERAGSPAKHSQYGWGACRVGLLAGFGVDLSRFFHETPPAPRVIGVHAFVFTGWMLLLTTQVLLVVGDRCRVA